MQYYSVLKKIRRLYAINLEQNHEIEVQTEVISELSVKSTHE